MTVIDEMVSKIKFLIDVANENYEMYGWNHSHELRLARIDGCLEMLSMLTNTEYYYDSDGLHERNVDKLL